MLPVLRAIQSHPKLQLQIVATGMHLDRRRGRSIDQIRAGGWKVDAQIPWDSSESSPVVVAGQTGGAMARLAEAFEKLSSEIVLVVGDRVEVFAAAAAGQVSQRVVAHVHGGDRALGQVDDSLRHAITKLAHIHFPATQMSATRLLRLGEDPWRIHRVGAPGIDGITQLATPSKLPKHRSALLVLHPVDADDQVEYRRARVILESVKSIEFERIVIIHPNNDPGSGGIVRCWMEHARGDRFIVHTNVDRPQFLGMMRDAAVLVGNSSSGIIEAASFGTPVVDIGPRQQGRDRSQNVTAVGYSPRAITAVLRAIWNDGRPRRFKGHNIYGGNGCGTRMAGILAGLTIDDRILRKLIAY